MKKEQTDREAVARWLYTDDGMVEWLCDWDKALPNQRDTYFRKADQILALISPIEKPHDEGWMPHSDANNDKHSTANKEKGLAEQVVSAIGFHLSDTWYSHLDDAQKMTGELEEIITPIIQKALISPIDTERLIISTLEWAGDRCPHTDREEPPMRKMDCVKCYNEYISQATVEGE